MEQINIISGRKLKNYSVLAGSALAATASADGQVIYHPLNPAVIVNQTNPQYNLDLNGDSSNDFRLQEYNGKTYTEASLAFSGTNKSVIGSIQSFSASGNILIGYPAAYNSGDKIGPSRQWFGLKNIKSTGGYYIYPQLAVKFSNGNLRGHWNAVTNKYLPLRIKTGSSYNYGWVRCSISESGHADTISGYAYEAIADSAIIAGDEGTTGISGHPIPNLTIYSYGKNIVVFLQGVAPNGMIISVKDISGRNVRTIRTGNEKNEMYFPELPSGIYTVTVRSGDAETTKKISIR